MARVVAGKPVVTAGIVVALAIALFVIERVVGMDANEMIGFSILFFLLAGLIYLAYRFGRDTPDHDHDH